jgi:hypothetical protein
MNTRYLYIVECARCGQQRHYDQDGGPGPVHTIGESRPGLSATNEWALFYPATIMTWSHHEHMEWRTGGVAICADCLTDAERAELRLQQQVTEAGDIPF